MTATLEHAILTDCLGLLVPTVVLSPRRGDCPTYPICRHAPGYCRYVREWYIDGTSVQLGRAVHVWPTREAAVNALNANGYAVDSKPCNLAGCHTVVHLATQVEAERRRLLSDAKWRGAKRCYVRYGDLPEDGHSYDHAGNIPERGVSVFDGQILPNGERRAIPRTNQQLGSLLTISDRPLYVITGDEIAIGADGEPVLANACIVAA